jgi:hypothetical protein
LQDARVTEPTPARGPDFLPYPLPSRPEPVALAPAGPLEPAGGRWAQALDGVTPWGVAAITAGVAALLSLLVVSLLGGHRTAGAVLAVLAGTVGAVAGVRALKDEQPTDSRGLVQGGAGTGVVAAVIALALALTHHSSVAEQPPVQVPLPLPTTSSLPEQPSPTPSPASPAPSPSAGVLPPGSDDLFGVPTQPDPPLQPDSTAKGTLTGRVVTSSGAPLPGATVVVTRADPTDTSDAPGCPLRVTTTTGADGRYRLQLCQLGDNLGYTVTISAGAAQARTQLYVNAGQTTVYNVVLPVRRA